MHSRKQSNRFMLYAHIMPEKRNVFNNDLHFSMDWGAPLLNDKLFQSLRASAEKALSPLVLFSVWNSVGSSQSSWSVVLNNVCEERLCAANWNTYLQNIYCVDMWSKIRSRYLLICSRAKIVQLKFEYMFFCSITIYIGYICYTIGTTMASVRVAWL